VSASRPDPSGALHQLHEEGVRTIAARIATRREALAHQMVERFCHCASEDDREAALKEEQYAFALESIDWFLESLCGAEPLTADWAASIRATAARRVHQRVSLAFFLHAARIWGEVLWDAVVTNAHIDLLGEREAAIEIASRLMRQVDIHSSIATEAYLDEITGRGLLRRDLFDALLTGRGDAADVRRHLRSLHLRLGDSYIVVAVRGAEMHGEVGHDEPLPSRVALDRIVETTRSRVRPSVGSLLAGVRHGDLVILYPVAGPGDLETVRQACAAIAESVAVDVSIGMSVCHRGLPAITTAYAEAREAVALASRMGIRGRAVDLDDVLIDHLLSASDHARRILQETVEPLRAYDRAHGTQMLATLEAYVRVRFNLTKAAEILYVHPNTVVYRLRRIRDLTGRDPHDVDDLVVLTLALKVLELRLAVEA
jgi:hypothetical protein